MRGPREGGDDLRPEARLLGRTGIAVPALGLGAGPLGDHALADADAIRFVHAALERGVVLLDTAPSYGASEERIGRALVGRRDQAVIVTKGGYGVPGCADWTPECIARGIDQALARLGTDHLDVFLLHSCPKERLARGDLLEPLVRARGAGKVRAVGYSGDGDALAWAVRASEIDVVECSVSLFDQEALSGSVPAAVANGVGVLAKRALGNAVWRFDARPERPDLAPLWDRMRTLYPTPPELGWEALAVRFATYAPGIATALVGTTSLHHLVTLLRHVAEGPLPAKLAEDARARFRRYGADWPGIV